MFGFGKKKESTIDLPSLQVPKPIANDEIDLIPEDIPSELPPLDIKPKQALISQTQAQSLFPSLPESAPEQIIVPKSTIIRKETSDKFLHMDTFKTIVSDINGIIADFDSLDAEVERAIEMKDARHEKMDALQNSLEDVSKRIMLVDATLFGGA